MTASILDGKTVALSIRKKIKHNVLIQLEQGKTAPGLAVILVGNNPASTIYVKHKRTACEEVGFHSFAYNFPDTIEDGKLLHLIEELNNAKHIHGILVQLPLPDHINSKRIIEHIHPNKDVDGFHPYNIGRLAQGNPHLRPCTPLGVITLLNHYNISLAGKHAVVIGASNIVGRPMALEFLCAKSTVTICNRSTVDLKKYVESADLVVVATGIHHLINSNWLQPHQVVVDIGIHRKPDGTVHGDLDFETAKTKVSWITPVPGGVGPMTIASLLENTWFAAHHLSK